ncbi:MAG: PKD repeat protein, partial [Saprospiraceae bacterium]
MKLANKFCLPILVLSILFLFPSCGSDSTEDSGDNENTAVEVDFLINGKKLLTESEDFLKDEIDINESDKVLQVRVGETVTFKDISTPKVSDDNREWDIFADNQPDGSSEVLEYPFQEVGLQDVELFVNNKSVRKLVYVVGEGEEIVEGGFTDEPVEDEQLAEERQKEQKQEQLAFEADNRAKDAAEADKRARAEATKQERAAKTARDEAARQKQLAKSANTDAERKQAGAAAKAAQERADKAARDETAAKKRAAETAEIQRKADLAAAQKKKDAENAKARRIEEERIAVEKAAKEKERVAAEVAKRKAVAETTRLAAVAEEKKNQVAKTPTKPTVSSISMSASRTSVNTNGVVSFTGSVTPAAAIESISWDFGDGTVKSTGARTNESHAYRTAGNYTVKMCVNGITNCKTVNVSVTAPPPPPPAPTPGADADFFCTSGNKAAGVGYADRCGDSQWTEQAAITLSPKRKLTLTKATVHAENSGRVQFKLTYNQGGATQNETITRSVNSGKSEIYLEELDVVMNPGITYTLSVKSVGDSKTKLENIVDCGKSSTGNGDLGINYKGNQVLFDL